MVDNEAKMKSSQGEDLQLSEDRLKEAEEMAWKSKAELSELVYALEQEQSTVKKLGAEIGVMQAKAVEDSSKHAEALKIVQRTMDLEVEVVHLSLSRNLPHNATAMSFICEEKIFQRQDCVLDRPSDL